MGQIEGFCNCVAQELDAMNFGERQQILRLVVERITLGDNALCIETIIPTGDDDVSLHYRHPGFIGNHKVRNTTSILCIA